MLKRLGLCLLVLIFLGILYAGSFFLLLNHLYDKPWFNALLSAVD